MVGFANPDSEDPDLYSEEEAESPPSDDRSPLERSSALETHGTLSDGISESLEDRSPLDRSLGEVEQD